MTYESASSLRRPPALVGRLLRFLQAGVQRQANVAVRRLSKIPNYLRRFGPIAGPRLLLRIEKSLPAKSNAVRSYRVPGYGRIYLRDTVSDHAIFWQCLVQCQYDFRSFPQTKRLMDSYARLRKRGAQPVIIDCGANIGLASLWLANCFPEARILAVEPDADNFRMLQRNTASFGARITPINAAVWPRREQLAILNPECGSAAFQVGGVAQGSHGGIAAMPISELCAMAGVEAPFIAKIDVEGAQSRLFESNTDWVPKTHLITLELDDWLMPWQGTSRSFFSCLSQYPFDYLIRGESIFCFRDFAEHGH